MFKLIIDASCIFDQPSGVGYYSLNLIDSLYSLKKEYNFELQLMYRHRLKNIVKGNWKLPPPLGRYEANTLKSKIPGKIYNLLYDYSPHTFARYLEAISNKVDIIHNPDYYILPFQGSQNVITIHDLTFLRYPQYINKVVKKYYNRILKSLSWVDLILTVSNSSKADIVKYLEVPSSKVRVTPLASRFRFTDFHQPSNVNHSLHNVNQPFLLFVGNIEPRKNIMGLIKAFDYLVKSYHIDHELVIIGQKGWKYDQIFKAINASSYRHRIHILNYVCDQQLLQFYQRASLLVYPSFYEGFGLPVLEAMTAGLPVITSNRSSLKEIAKEAAVLVDPNHYLEIAYSILEIINNPQLQQQLSKQGKRRASKFSWEKTAQLTIEAYRSII